MEYDSSKNKSTSIFSYVALALYILVAAMIIAMVVFDIFDTIPFVICTLLVYFLYVIATLIRVRIIRKKQLKNGIKPIDLDDYKEAAILKQHHAIKIIASAMEHYKTNQSIIKVLLSKGIEKETATKLIKQIAIYPQLIKNRMANGVKYCGIFLFILSLCIPVVFFGRKAAMFEGLQYAIAILYFLLGLLFYFVGRWMHKSITK